MQQLPPPSQPSPSLPQPAQSVPMGSGGDGACLLLLLGVGEQLFALETANVVEVIPRVLLRPVSGSPPHRPGVFNFRGRVVPVVDVSQLIAGNPCAEHLSSRIIMVRHRSGGSGERDGLVGLLAERVTDTVLKSLNSFQPADGAAQLAPFLGGVALDERGLIQLLHADALAQVGLAQTPEEPETDARG